MEEKELKRTALLVSLAAILQIAESFFPTPLPGLKLGLANMIVLIALVKINFRAAVEIAVFRTIISSLILGTFLSPTFIMSFSGSLTSTLVMGALYMAATRNGKYRMSLVGISLIGAAVHNFTQLMVVYLFFIKSSSVFFFMSWLGISSVAMGWITGMIASHVCSQLDKYDSKEEINISRVNHAASRPIKFSMGRYFKSNSTIHKTPAMIKIICMLLLAGTAVFAANLTVMTALYAFVITCLIASRVPFNEFTVGFKKSWVFLIFAFILPAFFSGAGRFGFTSTGIMTGAVSGARIILLMLGATILIKTTRPKDIANGLAGLMKPFKFIGFSGKRAAIIMSSALVSLPALWEKAESFIKERSHKEKSLKAVMASAALLLVALYIKVEEEINI